MLDVLAVEFVIEDNFTCSGSKDVESVGSVNVVDCEEFDNEGKEGKVHRDNTPGFRQQVISLNSGELN